MVGRQQWVKALWVFGMVIAGIGWMRGLPHLVRIGERMDLAAYYGAGLALVQGLPLYDSITWAPFMSGIRYTPYIYPPFTAVVMRIVVPLGWPVVDSVWLAMNVGLTMAIVRELRIQCDLNGRQTMWLAVLTCWLPAWYENLLFGQVGLLVTWGLLYALRVRAAGAGMLLGILAAIKIYPLVFVGAVLRGRWRIGVAAVLGTLLVTAIIGLWGAPPQESWRFWQEAVFMQAPAPLWAPSRQGLYNSALRLFTSHELVAAILDVEATQTYTLPAISELPWVIVPVWLSASLAVVWWSWRWYRQQARQPLELLAVLSCVFLLVYPAQHNHYSIQLVIPFAMLIARHESRWQWPLAWIALALFRWWRPLMLVSVSPLLMMWSVFGVLLVWYLLITPAVAGATTLPRDHGLQDHVQ